MRTRLVLFACVLFVLGLAAPAGLCAANTAPVTLTCFFSDPNANWANMQDEIGQIITQKTGVKIDAQFAVGDPDDKIKVIIASGDYPDMIQPKGSSYTMVDAGAMVDLTDMLPMYAPNIMKVIGDQFDRMKLSLDDPRVFYVPSVDAIGQISFDVDTFFKLQLGALKEQNYPRVQLLSDYEKVIAAYVKAHPMTNGQPTIGLSLLADDWRFVISTTNPAFWATGAADDGEWYIDPTAYKAIPHVMRPGEREYFRWLNHINDVGLLDKESFTQTYDQYKAKIATGRVVGVIDADWEIGDAVNSLKAAGMFDKTYGHFPVVVKPGIKAAWNQLAGFRGGWGIGITKSCKDPVLALKFLDYLASDEGQVLINWGVKDVDYKVDNGKRVIPADVLNKRVNDTANYQRTTGLGNPFGNYFLSVHYGDGVKDPSGNYYTIKSPDTIPSTYSDLERQALAGYKATLWSDMIPKAIEFKPIPWAAAWSIPVSKDSPLNEFWNVEQDITRKYIPQAILGKPTDFDKTYDAMMTELNNQCGKYCDLETKLVQDRLKLWGYLK